MGAKYFGAAVRRREDPRLLRGEGRYLDDVKVAGLVHEAWGTNVGVGFTHGIGDVEAAFAHADVVLSETFHIQRYVGMPLEPRGVVALWDRRDGALTTWNSTQVSHFVQQGLAPALGLPH